MEWNPTLLGNFSTNGEKESNKAKFQLKYLKLPEKLTGLSYDLNNGREYKSCDHTTFSMKNFLKWIKKHRNLLQTSGLSPSKKRKIDIDFVMSRRDMLAVCSKFFSKDAWKICARKFQNTIYMLKFCTQEEIKAVKNRTKKAQTAIKYGNKFEKYITSDTKRGRPNPNSPVDESEHFFVVAKNSLNGHSLLYTAEVDAVDPRKRRLNENSPKRYVEIKLKTEKPSNYECEKLLKWWLQSYLIGIENIICGLHDNTGIVTEIQVLKTADLLIKAKREENYGQKFSPEAYLNSLSDFLLQVKEVTSENENEVYEFSYQPDESVTCRKVSSSQYEILNKEFIEYFNRSNSGD